MNWPKTYDMIDEAAVRRFNLFGFVVLRDLFTPEEVGRLRDEVEGGLRDQFGGRVGTNTRDDTPAGEDEDLAAEGNFMPLMANRSPLSQELVADDRRLVDFATAVFGECSIASPALATLLTSDTPWHNDPGSGDRWLRLNAYLQPATAGAGALRVVPASHRGSLPADIAEMLRSDPSLRALPEGLPGFAIETRPGDVIAFDPRVHHGAWGGGARLRWSLDFVAMPSLDDVDAVAHARGLIAELSDWPTSEAWPTWSEWAARDTAPRQAAVAKLRALGIRVDV